MRISSSVNYIGLENKSRIQNPILLESGVKTQSDSSLCDHAGPSFQTH